MTDLTDQLRTVKARIESAARVAERDPSEITLVAVSKTRSAAEVLALAAAGQRDFGENRVPEALTKIEACRGQGLCWHFIGPLQANKTRQVSEHFDWVHSLDRERIAERLGAQRPEGLAPLQVCLQVNLGGETQKAGVMPDAVPELARRVATISGLSLRGLMCLPPAPQQPGDSTPWFRQLRELGRRLADGGVVLDTLSMGMTADLEEAVAEGATMVRIGTAVFGPRHD